MNLGKISTLLTPFVTFCVVIAVSLLVIAYGRGYRLDLRKNSVKPTGLISATSDPIGAQVLVDTKLRSATNNAFPIDPGWYTVRIIKEGYIGWEKNLRIQGEVVTRADAFLFPTNPSLSPLTTSGAQAPTLSPDGTKIAYTIPFDAPREGAAAKAGLWILELVDRPLGRNRDPQLLGQSETGFNLSNAILLWSPDSSQLLTVLPSGARLYTTGKAQAFEDVSISYEPLLKIWQEEKDLKDRQKLAAFKEDFINVTTSSAKIISFSPDETKLLYEATASAVIPLVITPPQIGANPTQESRTVEPGKLYVYDSKEDKNFFLLDKKELPTTPAPSPQKSKAKLPSIVSPSEIPVRGRLLDNWIIGNSNSYGLEWFPTSRHLILTGNGKLDIMEYDRTNWITVYSGPFVDGFVAPWTNGTRLIIMTNLNPNAGSLPNLYTVNLR